jgi:hypothetical protein
VTERCGDETAAEERQGDTDNSHGHGGASDRAEFCEVHLETDVEQQQ